MSSKIVAALPKLSRWAFFATLILIPFRLQLVLRSRPIGTIWGGYTDYLLYLSDIAFLLTIFPWLLSLLLQKKRPGLAPRFVTFPLAGLTIIVGISSFFSIDPGLALYNFVRLALLFIFYLYAVNNLKRLQDLIIPISFQLGIQSVVGVAQVLKQSSLGLQKLGEWSLDPAVRGVSVIWTETSRSLRAYGLSDHPNILGGCLLFGILLLFVWLIEHKGESIFLQFLIFSLGLVALLLTFSRSAWLAGVLSVGLIAYFYFRQRKRNLLVRASALLAGALFLLFPFILANGDFLGSRLGANQSLERVRTEVASLQERAVLNRATNEVFIDHSLIGVGVGALPEAFQIKYPDFGIFYQPGHIALLDVAAETGIFGALFYLTLLVVPWVALALKSPKALSPNLIAASSLLLAITVIGFFDYYTWLSAPGRLWQWLAWGFWGRAYVDNA